LDSAGPLLTPASNLLYQATLTAATATIDTGALSQGYRDLMIVLDGASDTAATSTTLRVVFNNESSTNFDGINQVTSTSTIGSTAMVLSRIAGATAPASTTSLATITIPNYTGTLKHKTCSVISTIKLANSAGNLAAEASAGWWRNTSAITSVQFALGAGNWIAGTTVKVYGLPSSDGGATSGVGTRLRISANQSIADATDSLVNWDTEDTDADNQHFTSAAALTGTVSKTAGSTILSGSGTQFGTELSVGQVIAVPGTATEKRVVIAVGANIVATVNAPFANSASGQTGTRINSAVSVRQPGFYAIDAGAYWASNATGNRKIALILNDTTVIAQDDRTSIGATAMGQTVSTSRQFGMWDFVEVLVRQNSGGALNLTADDRTFLDVSARPTIIVAVPYVNVQDQKSQNTAGGTFTSGADQTRVLNTLQADRAGIATVGGNQVLLPAGVYRCQWVAPAAGNVGAHQSWLYNTTSSATLLRGIPASMTTAGDSNVSTGSGSFTLTVPSVLELRHRCTNTVSTSGFGIAANFGTEVYAIVEFWKEG